MGASDREPGPPLGERNRFANVRFMGFESDGGGARTRRWLALWAAHGGAPAFATTGDGNLARAVFVTLAGRCFWNNAVLPLSRKADRAREGMSGSLFASSPAAERGSMQILYSRCCGIDVHKDSVTVCVLVYSGSPEPEVRKKEFATYFKALLNLKMWLLAQKVTHVAMESTGVYWKPVWQESLRRGPANSWPYDVVLVRPREKGASLLCKSAVSIAKSGRERRAMFFIVN